MRKKKKTKKTILVISDLHLSAGEFVNGSRNILEDFQSDKELVDFFNYYSSDEYGKNKEVEVIINGDFYDFLAVPYVDYFDDEFYSEEACVEKLQVILDAHHEVTESMIRFLESGNKKIVYILGNHDAELILPEVQKLLLYQFPEKIRENFVIMDADNGYTPIPQVAIRHGHQYEVAHKIDFKKSVIEFEGRNHFLPPWGSYYVTHIVNKFKEERSYINQVRPIKVFLIQGLLYDTLFTFRFMMANVWYFVSTRFLKYLKNIRKQSLSSQFQDLKGELTLFDNYEHFANQFFKKNSENRVLIVGHTHIPMYRRFSGGQIYINTGTWTKMLNLGFSPKREDDELTYAKITILEGYQASDKGLEHLEVGLNVWSGRGSGPFHSFA